MPSESQRAVKVRLEIEIPQGESAVVLQSPEGRAISVRDAILNISQPSAAISGPTLVKARHDVTVDQWLICTQGAVQPGSGAPPRSVFAGVYPQGSAVPQEPAPPAGTAGQILDANGQWGVMTPFELPVIPPDGVHTFGAWAEYPDGHFQNLILAGQPRDFTINQTGVTECGQGISSSGGGVVTSCCPGVGLPTTLQAHTSFGVFPLTFNNSGWVFNGQFGSCPPSGAQTLQVRCDSGVWRLQSAASPSEFAPTSVSCSPFQLVFANVDLSRCGGLTNDTVEVLTS